jgi:hypothetical protein
MSRSKALFVTALVMTLMSAVIFFIWLNGRGFGIVEALFALYGYGSFAADLCRWMRMPDATILRGGRHG